MTNKHSPAAKDHNSRKSAPGRAGYALVASVAALAGFGAVYVTFTPSDNGAGAEISRKAPGQRAGPGLVNKSGNSANQSANQKMATAARPASNNGKTASNRLNRLNRGHMATFVFKKPPQPLADVTFKDGDGNTRSLKDWRGKVVLLNLWATWCAPCRREMPDLDKLQGALGSDKFEVVAVSIDRKGLKASRRFLDQIKVKNLRTYNDASTRMAGRLRVLGMPTTLLLDREGREIGRLVGPANWNSADAHRLIKAHL